MPVLELDAMPTESPPPLPDLYEVVDGKIVEKKMGVRQSTIGFQIAARLWQFTYPKKLGWATTEALFRLSDGAPQRRPDAAFVSTERWPFDVQPPESNAWDVVPDLAVEVISPTNTMDEIDGKIDEYLEAGVRLVWIVFTSSKKIRSYGPSGEESTFRHGDTLTAEPVLPGFALPLVELFGA